MRQQTHCVFFCQRSRSKHCNTKLIAGALLIPPVRHFVRCIKISRTVVLPAEIGRWDATCLPVVVARDTTASFSPTQLAILLDLRMVRLLCNVVLCTSCPHFCCCHREEMEPFVLRMSNVTAPLDGDMKRDCKLLHQKVISRRLQAVICSIDKTSARVANLDIAKSKLQHDGDRECTTRCPPAEDLSHPLQTFSPCHVV